MKRRRGYHHLTDGEWYRPSMRAHWDQCCDCAKIHKIKFRVFDKDGKRVAGAYVEFCATEDVRASAAARRNFKFDPEPD